MHGTSRIMSLFFFFFEITNMYCDFMNTEGLLIPIYEKLNSNCSSHNVKNCTPTTRHEDSDFDDDPTQSLYTGIWQR